MSEVSNAINPRNGGNNFDYSKGKEHDDKSNQGIDKGVFNAFNFFRISGRLSKFKTSD